MPHAASRSPFHRLIFLVGMPGAGKTFWARKLAVHYGWHFADLDHFIEQQEQSTISGLFSTTGEDGFRVHEHHYLKQLISIAPRPAVIASGGGTPCFFDNLRLMQSAGKVIYLRAEIPYLLGNMMQNKEIRPLLAGKPDPATYLAGLLAQRELYYRKADFILDAETISLRTFEETISLC